MQSDKVWMFLLYQVQIFLLYYYSQHLNHINCAQQYNLCRGWDLVRVKKVQINKLSCIHWNNNLDHQHITTRLNGFIKVKHADVLIQMKCQLVYGIRVYKMAVQTGIMISVGKKLGLLNHIQQLSVNLSFSSNLGGCGYTPG